MPRKAPKVLIYSHDSFGLGHLRRCRTIAHSLVGEFDDMSVLIMSGSPIIGSFDFRTRVDFVRIPGVTKLRSGDYSPLSLQIDIEETVEIRASIIEHTARVFRPDVFLVDKEPLGLRGEVRRTLERLSDTDTHLVLGLRDVMDDPDMLAEEWSRKGAQAAIEELYDEVWVYGLPEIHDPLEGVGVSDAARRRALFTGYLRRELPNIQPAGTVRSPFGEDPYILVSPGGGGDGVELVDWVMRAYEAHHQPLFPALIVLGPFMDLQHQADFIARAERLRDVHVIAFTPNMEALLDSATAIVGMGGYNIFCEILSFDKPTLLVPRVVPRMEQSIRAAHAEAAGLLKVLAIDHYPDVDLMLEALAELPKQQPPSRAGLTNLLNGLDVINGRVAEILGNQTAQPARALAHG